MRHVANDRGVRQLGQHARLAREAFITVQVRPGDHLHGRGGAGRHVQRTQHGAHAASPGDALDAAREASGGRDVRIGGGATVARDFIAAGLVDHVHLVQVPIVLGRGVRLWDGLEALEADYDIEAVSTPSGVTHLTFTRS